MQMVGRWIFGQQTVSSNWIHAGNCGHLIIQIMSKTHEMLSGEGHADVMTWKEAVERGLVDSTRPADLKAEVFVVKTEHGLKGAKLVDRSDLATVTAIYDAFGTDPSKRLSLRQGRHKLVIDEIVPLTSLTINGELKVVGGSWDLPKEKNGIYKLGNNANIHLIWTMSSE